MKKCFRCLLVALLVLPCAFIMSACGKDDKVNVRVNGDYIQWQTDGSDNWNNIMSVDDLLDQIGDDIKGNAGAAGVNGREIEFDKNATHIQWRYVGDDTWTDLISIVNLIGPAGPPGMNASYANYTVTLDYGVADEFF